jgi:acetyl esterase/lipase
MLSVQTLKSSNNIASNAWSTLSNSSMSKTGGLSYSSERSNGPALKNCRPCNSICRDSQSTYAAEWHIDPQRIGALGFSAGAHLVVILGNHADFKREGAPETPESKLDARPNFVVVIYPGYLSDAPDLTKIAPAIGPSATTPPTFLLQAEDDPVHEENSLLYFQALKELKVPAELHIYAEGGHGYGLRPTELPVTHWPTLAETWFHTIHVLGAPAAH